LKNGESDRAATSLVRDNPDLAVGAMQDYLKMTPDEASETYRLSGDHFLDSHRCWPKQFGFYRFQFVRNETDKRSKGICGKKLFKPRTIGGE
jgi:hypothetical protein